MIEFAPTPAARPTKAVANAALQPEPVVRKAPPVVELAPLVIEMPEEPALPIELQEVPMPGKAKAAKAQSRRKPKISAETAATQLSLETAQ